MDTVPCGVRSVTIPSGESRKLGATALKVLERKLDEIARNDQIVSGGEKVFGGNVCELAPRLEQVEVSVHEICGNLVTILGSTLMMT